MSKDLGEVRTGDELDLGKVDEFTRSHVPDLKGSLHIQQFKDGASNLTYLLSYENRDLILRRPPRGHISKNAHDMGREYRVMSALKKFFPYVPEMIAYSEDASVVDSPFYLMDRIKGTVLRNDYPKGFSLAADQATVLNRTLIDVLVQLHQIDYKSAGLEDLGKGEGYIPRQIEGWYKRYSHVETDDAPDLKPIYRWLKEQMPEQVGVCLIHNDYRFDNVVLDEHDPSRIVGVLDWEMSTLGDPLMDLGNSLAYWIEAGDPPELQKLKRQPSNQPGMLSRRAFLDYYQEKSGLDLSGFAYYLVYGYFRLIGVIQQLYYRYKEGKTKDPRFANVVQINHLYSKLCHNLIDKGKI